MYVLTKRNYLHLSRLLLERTLCTLRTQNSHQLRELFPRSRVRFSQTIEIEMFGFLLHRFKFTKMKAKLFLLMKHYTRPNDEIERVKHARTLDTHKIDIEPTTKKMVENQMKRKRMKWYCLVCFSFSLLVSADVLIKYSPYNYSMCVRFTSRV